jgi:hypothetical protein
MSANITINGGKIYVDGVEFQKTGGEDVVSGTVGGNPCIISAGVVYVNDTCVGSVPYEAFVAWQEDANEEV